MIARTVLPRGGQLRLGEGLVRIRLGIALLLVGTACVTPRRIALPVTGASSPPPLAQPPAPLCLDTITVTNLGRSLGIGWRHSLGLRFARATARGLGTRSVGRCVHQGDEGRARGTLRLLFRPREERHRTLLLDALNAGLCLGLFPFTPEWGEVSVELDAELRRPDHAPVRVRLETRAPYDQFLYAWYRTHALEAAYERAYEDLAKRLPVAFASALGRASVHRAVPQSRTSSTADSIRPAPKSATTAADPLRPPRLELVALPPLGPHARTRPRAPATANRWLALVRPLGGLSFSHHRGWARVWSDARVAGRPKERLATGDAKSSGFRLQLEAPPPATGLFFPPRVAVMTQDIEISGFRQAIPLYVPAGTDVIPAVASDPSTGERVDLDQAIAYRLSLKRFLLGQGVGAHLVYAFSDFELYASMLASLHLVEIRHTRVQIHRSEVSGTRVVPLGAVTGALSLGTYIPALRMAAQLDVEGERYRPFRFPQPVEFQAAVQFNETLETFERKNVLVDQASFAAAQASVKLIWAF